MLNLTALTILGKSQPEVILANAGSGIRQRVQPRISMFDVSVSAARPPVLTQTMEPQIRGAWAVAIKVGRYAVRQLMTMQTSQWLPCAAIVVVAVGSSGASAGIKPHRIKLCDDGTD